MSTSLAEYQVDHLFLLMGKNPLPNYVAARTLLREGGTPYFVHTKDTFDSAKRLREILCNDLSKLKTAQLISLEDYECDSYYIQDKICFYANQIKNERVGLNYTGGTKAMSVHAYRALLRTHSDAIFSYLDPRRLEMCIDREDGERIRRKVSLKLSLKEVFKLHVPDLKKPLITKPHLPDVAKVLAASSEEWSTWINNILLPEAKKKKPNGTWGIWEGTQKLKSLLLPIKGLPEQVVHVFQTKEFITPDELFSLKEFQEKGKFSLSKKPLEEAGEWLTGKWLEHYVLDQVQEKAKDYFIHDYAMSVNVPIKPETDDDFELDVAFMRNYQLFAISCTTDAKKALCKEKLFEAYLRANQLGGDESRVALVCCFDQPDALKAEIEVSIKDRKIAVFGRDDLAELSDKISTWIEQSVEEAQ